MNQKGGVGKTATAVNVAAVLGGAGKRVLVIDVDPQANASKYLGVQDDGRGLLDVFLGEEAEAKVKLDDIIQAGVAPGVDLVPASPWLRKAETQLIGEPGCDSRLRKALRGAGERWDYVLIDCPPSLGILSVNALAASTEVLVPVEASGEAIEGFVELRRTVQKVKDSVAGCEKLAIVGVVVCRFDATTVFEPEQVDNLKEHLDSLLFKTVVRKNIRLKEAYTHRRPVVLYAPTSYGAEAYRAVAAELQRRRAR
jgi:chromosome partitioning protein